MDDFLDLRDGLLHDLRFDHYVAALRSACCNGTERPQRLDKNHSRVLRDAHLTSGADQATELFLDYPRVTLVHLSLDLVKRVQDFLLLIDSNAEQTLLEELEDALFVGENACRLPYAQICMTVSIGKGRGVPEELLVEERHQEQESVQLRRLKTLITAAS